jgi:ABC-type polysaccharide/polyol phosphate export permease
VSARWLADVLAALTSSDLRMRYGRGRIRYLKWLSDPIAALGIYLLLVALLDRSADAAGLSIACAIVPFQLLMASVINAAGAVSLRGSIIINMRFPRVLLPLSSVATESIAGLAALTLLPAMMIVYGVAPTIDALWVIPALAVTMTLAVSLSYPAALVGVWYPEMIPFLISLVRALFFLAPGLVALDAITGTARDLVPYNPFTGIFESFRDALLYGQAPAIWEFAAPLGMAAVVAVVAIPIYRREQEQLAKLVG